MIFSKLNIADIFDLLENRLVFHVGVYFQVKLDLLFFGEIAELIFGFCHFQILALINGQTLTAIIESSTYTALVGEVGISTCPEPHPQGQGAFLNSLNYAVKLRAGQGRGTFCDPLTLLSQPPPLLRHPRNQRVIVDFQSQKFEH